MRGLYAIVDMGTLAPRGIDPVRFAEAVLLAHPAALQVRAKDRPAREILGLLRAIAPICHRVKVPLVANDRADLASFAGCDMVHVGQDDISVDLARRIAPGMGAGVSTHNPEQLRKALEARPTYVAYGPVYATSSKRDAAPVVGLDGLRQAAAACAAAGVPLVAIGGITLERVAEIAAIADMAATIAALVPPTGSGAELLAEVTARARAFQAAFEPRPGAEAAL
jgi:thiamine-phosphate pyrophosphorylase